MSGADDDLSGEDSQEVSEELDLSDIEIPEEVSSETEDNFDDILAGIDGITEDDISSDSTEDNFDDILAGIDGVTEDEEKVEIPASKNIEESIDQSKYPLPVEKEHKVVNQLNEVAEDSEQKASQIFDVLSFVLDENNEIQTFNSELNTYLEKQNELLEALSTKFPNVDLFKENFENTQSIIESSKSLTMRLDNENNKIFEAMELMQYHDINRQKIERVMSVIRKLNDYLNGIFEDDSDKPQVQIAKHISGDSNETVGEDDLEALISEFGNEG